MAETTGGGPQRHALTERTPKSLKAVEAVGLVLFFLGLAGLILNVAGVLVRVPVGPLLLLGLAVFCGARVAVWWRLG